MFTEFSRLPTLPRRKRGVLIVGLAAVTVVAWICLFSMAAKLAVVGEIGIVDMASEMAMPAMQGWETGELLLLFVMWWVMMIAMMVPTVAPMVLMFARINRQKGGHRIVRPAGSLLLGYLVVWAGFSALTVPAQWGLHHASLLSPMMMSTSSVFGGSLLMTAGVFQFTPLKRACLTQCRSPLSFLMSNWRDGRWGPFIIGLKHGAYCLGCCWLLMALMFVVGVMNLLWAAVIAVFVLIEKVAPRGDLLVHFAGALLIMAGIALIVR